MNSCILKSEGHCLFLEQTKVDVLKHVAIHHRVPGKRLNIKQQYQSKLSPAYTCTLIGNHPVITKKSKR